MNPNLTFARSGFLHRARFVVVNDRVPRTDGPCALYVRDTDAIDLLRYGLLST